jgi:hypothetical protein
MPGGTRSRHDPAAVGERGRTEAWGAAAGVAAVVLFLAGAVAVGDRPAFDAAGAELVDHFASARTRIQLAAALDAAATALLVWFLATVWSRAREHTAAAVAFGCGVAYASVFLVDVTALAVGALRADELTPEVARLLVDFEWVAIAMAAPLAVGMLAAFAVLALREAAVWPRWVGALAAVAAVAHALRVGALFRDDGPFAADGVLGLYVPVGALVACILCASVTLTRRTTRPAG